MQVNRANHPHHADSEVRSHRKIGLIAFAVLAIAGSLSQAAAANLVSDGGFEGDAAQNYSAANYLFPLGPSTFGPWTVNNGFVSVDGFSVQAHSGNDSLSLAPGNPAFPSDITQTLSTVSGETYDLTFYAAAGGENTFAVKFDGTTVVGSPTSLPSTIPMFASDFSRDYAKYSFTVVASSDQSVLEFGGTSTDSVGAGPDTIQLDDISVTAAGGVPEPSTWIMMISGMILAGAMLRSMHRGGPQKSDPARVSRTVCQME